ncbi:hypothetical protein F3087_41640 [Nocardia colli]|uniref:Uncharacterized protein n=1 Tax=Nocardia colli TaxID=2545717 RepID=A0A5N0DTG5_9NOCA|nr:hypothetical protein [Nocardia colli]KAA8880377.1 hypothetical protein F3087_41640 [Nocardia colli]
MPTFKLVPRPQANATNHGAAYDISPTEEAPIHGHVFVDVTDHLLYVDSRLEPRPAVVFRFFGLTVADHDVGNPSCTVEFIPDWAGPTTHVGLVILGEQGHLNVRLGPRVNVFPPVVTAQLCDLMIAITRDFLTDLRVAKHRYDAAEQYRNNAALAHEQAQINEQLTHQAFLEARTICDAAFALLNAVSQPKPSR